MIISNGVSVVDRTGKFVFISVDDFKHDICDSNTCFLCGQPLTADNQDKEHIMPDWLLKKFDMYNHQATLPNGTKLKFKQYFIPCCTECHHLLNKRLETPVSLACAKGFSGIQDVIQSQTGVKNLYIWLALLFLKTHLHDKSLRLSLDNRVPLSSSNTSIRYEWDTFHHVYCLSRTPYTEMVFDHHSIGSFIILPIHNMSSADRCSYMDIPYANTAGVILNDIGIIAVFGDACAVINRIRKPMLSPITSALSPIQFRELLAYFACCHLQLSNPPRYSVITDPAEKFRPKLVCHLPTEDPYFKKYDPILYGTVLTSLLNTIMENQSEIEGMAVTRHLRERMLAGEISFLFTPQGHFISHSNPVPTTES